MKIIEVKGLRDLGFISDYICDIYKNAKHDIIYEAIFRSDIKLNGEIVNEDVLVSNGDLIELNLFFFHLGLPPVLDILYEDENFLAIEKMPGVLTFDEYKTGEINVYDMALEYMLQKGEYSVESLIVPYLCYTLSEFAGGVLLIAKNEESYHYMTASLKQRKVSMVYEAIVLGHPKVKETEEYHYIDNNYNITTYPQSDTLPIVTRYKVLEEYHKYSKLEIETLTIRKFQANVHLAYLGHPILGDPLFGNRRINKKTKVDYEMIWLRQVSFSVGEGQYYSYLNHVKLKMEEIAFPNFVYKKGRNRLK